MILYHTTKYNLGHKFVACRPTCCAPTIAQAIFGLQDLICYKKSLRKHTGKLYVYKCDTKSFYDGKEFDAHIVKEKIVDFGTRFTLVKTFDAEFVKYLNTSFLYSMLEAPTLLYKKELDEYMKLVLKMIRRALKREQWPVV